MPASSPRRNGSSSRAFFAFVNGTSQRSWLDGFTPKKLKGGKNNGDSHPEPNDPAEAASNLLALTLRNLLDWNAVVGNAPLWTHLTDQQRDTLDERMVAFHSNIVEARRLARKGCRAAIVEDK